MKHLIAILLVVISTNAFAKPCNGEEYDLKIGLHEVFLQCMGKGDWRSKPILESETITQYATYKVYKVRYWRKLPNGEYESYRDKRRIYITNRKVTMISG